MATSMYIKFEEPNFGSSDAPGHHDEIEILSWSHGFVQPTSPTRSGGGEQATHQNLSFTKYLDRSTNDLLKYSWSGKQIGKATITCFRSDGAADNKPVLYLAVTMQHVIISNYSVSGGPGDIPVENVLIDYGIIQYTYVDQKHADSA
jgi:type VI secretion system secreted protein Hcp